MPKTERRHPNVVNLDEVEPNTRLTGTRFGGTMRWLGLATGARAIGCTHYEIPPGRAAFPHHYHCANEEALYVLEGEGTLRIGDERVELGAGDWVTLPVGPDHAHQLLNTGEGPLRYLCLSTKNPVEVVGYPDSGKIGAMALEPGKTFFDPPWIRGIFKADATVDYFDGEQTE